MDRGVVVVVVGWLGGWVVVGGVTVHEFTKSQI